MSPDDMAVVARMGARAQWDPQEAIDEIVSLGGDADDAAEAVAEQYRIADEREVGDSYDDLIYSNLVAARLRHDNKE